MGTLTKTLVPTKKQVQKIGSRVGFVELMARSNFSFLQGASHPEEMVEQAIYWDYDGIGLCDLHGLYGVARGYKSATSPSSFEASLQAKSGFRYLIGTEFILTDQSQLIAMPQTKRGYNNLCKLITLGKRNADKGFCKLTLDEIQKHPEDLLIFAVPPISEERFLQLQNAFGSQLYVPVWRDFTWESLEFYGQAVRLEEKYGAQLFVTNRPFMHAPERKKVFDVVTCIHHQTTLDEANTILIQNGERYLKPLEEIFEIWKDRLDLVEKTVHIAATVDFTLDQIRYQYPQADLPEAMSPTQYLRHLTEKGLRVRLGNNMTPKIRQTVEHELKLIEELQYEDYFLTLYEICQYAREHKILFQGRGSAANSVVCFAIGLTNVNPTQIDLLFERFISKERGEPPDIDIDFEHSRREEVIQHIYQKYGESHAAMVCTVIRFRSRMAFRETAKVFGLKTATINSIIRHMGRDGLRRLLEDPGIFTKFSVSEDVGIMILQLTQQVHGFPRHLGIHTGGFLITQDPLNEMVPVEKATMEGRYVIQWNKDDVNFLKLMKIDLLSLGMLTALRKCLQLLEDHKSVICDLSQLPADDKATYQMICKADTVGVFQIESRAQMQTLPRLKPQNFYDLVVEVALVRPGPLQGGMVHPYLRRRQGLEKPVYPHPKLEPVLKKTLGVPIFQEQVMKIAIEGAGFTAGEADELRRIMSDSWRKRGSMDGIKHRIMGGLRENGISETYAEQIYKTIEGFANYGFPESHAASFALLTYASCYIKCHHPDVFACALLNSQPMGFYPPRALIADAQRHGVAVLPLDIRQSDYDYSLENGNGLCRLRVGLRSIYGMPEKSLRDIVENRKQHGPFLNFEDFVLRSCLQKAHLLKLAATGALDCFASDTRQLLWKIESLCLDPNSFLQTHSRESFDLQTLPSLPKENQWQEMNREYQTKGFSVDKHPLSVLRAEIERKNQILRSLKYVPYFCSTELNCLRHKAKARVAGLVGLTQRPPTAKGYCFITLEDEFGFINIVVPKEVYERDRLLIYSEGLLEVQGHIEKTGSIINLKAHRLKPLARDLELRALANPSTQHFGL